MEGIKSMYQEMSDWLSSPFRRDMPIGQLLLIFVLFCIAAFIVFDMMRILKTWVDGAAEVIADTVS